MNDDIHAVADHSLVRRDVEIASIQRDRGFPTGNCGPLHARAEAERRDLEHDFLRHALHRENAGNVIGLATSAFPRLALEGHGWEFGGGKEIGRSEEHTSELKSPCNLV